MDQNPESRTLPSTPAAAAKEAKDSLWRWSSFSPRAIAADWPVWWHNLSLFEKWAPLAGTLIYCGTFAYFNSLRADHLWIATALLALSYAGRLARPLLSFALPLILTSFVYDTQRFYALKLRGRIRVEEPYWFDKTFFGISTSQGVLTPNEWWAQHTHWILDFYTGFFYLTFIAIFVSMALYFRFWLSRRGTAKLPAQAIRLESPRMMWAFFWLNVLGYSTYYWYPAAPPWYVARYGFGPVILDAPPSPAGAIRFDELLGTSFFTGMYSKSANVFGAIPSLHIAYPLLALYFAFRLGALRKFSVFYYLSLCFAAVYLNHHYIIDLIWGSAYALLIGWMVTWVGSKRAARRGLGFDAGPLAATGGKRTIAEAGN